MIESTSFTEDSVDDFLGSVETNTADKPTWSVVTVSLNICDVNFKIDTEADVTIIYETVLKKLNGIELQPCNRSLRDCARKTLRYVVSLLVLCNMTTY